MSETTRKLIRALERDVTGEPEEDAMFEGQRHAADVARLRSARKTIHKQKWLIRGLFVTLALFIARGFGFIGSIS